MNQVTTQVNNVAVSIKGLGVLMVAYIIGNFINTGLEMKYNGICLNANAGVYSTMTFDGTICKKAVNGSDVFTAIKP